MEIIEAARSIGKYIIFCIAAVMCIYAGKYKSETLTSKIIGYSLGIGFIIAILVAFCTDILL